MQALTKWLKKNHVPTKCKLQLYYANMYSRVQYGIEIFGHASCNNVKKIQTVQNESLKTLFNLKWDTSTNELHHHLKVFKVCDVFKIRILEFVYKSIDNILPTVFTNYCQTVNEIHRHGTRNGMKLHVKQARTCSCKKTAQIQGAEIFNGLPKDITNCKTVKSFRKSLRRHIIYSYIT